MRNKILLSFVTISQALPLEVHNTLRGIPLALSHVSVSIGQKNSLPESGLCKGFPFSIKAKFIIFLQTNLS